MKSHIKTRLLRESPILFFPVSVSCSFGAFRVAGGLSLSGVAAAVRQR